MNTLMCCNYFLHNKLNRLVERCFFMVPINFKFKPSLEKDSSVSIHYQIMKCQAIEMFKIFEGSRPQIVKDIFQCREVLLYQIINKLNFQTPLLHYVFNRTASMKFPEPKFRSSPWEVFLGKGILKICSKFTGENPWFKRKSNLIFPQLDIKIFSREFQILGKIFRD